MSEEKKDWGYCPECGSDKSERCSDFAITHRQCMNCGQEWHYDIDYTDVVRGHLSALLQAREKLAEETAARNKLHAEYVHLLHDRNAQEGLKQTAESQKWGQEKRAEAAESRALAAEKERDEYKESGDTTLGFLRDAETELAAQSRLLDKAREALVAEQPDCDKPGCDKKAVRRLIVGLENVGEYCADHRSGTDMGEMEELPIASALAQLPVTPAPTQEVIYVCIKCGDKKPFVGSAPAPVESKTTGAGSQGEA